MKNSVIEYGDYAQDAIDRLREDLRTALKSNDKNKIKWFRAEIAFYENLLHGVIQ